MSITSDEVNFLVYRYLQESGFGHSAFTFAYESQITKTNVVTANVPPGALISFIQKGLQYVGIEAHVNDDGTERECDDDMSLLSPHVCKMAQGATRQVKSSKRKRREHAEELAKNNNLSVQQLNDLQIHATDVLSLVGHSAEVFSCAWSPIDNILASSSGDATARLWTLPSHSTSVKGIFSSSALPPAKVCLHTMTSTPQSHGEGEKSTSIPTTVKKDVTTLEWSPDGASLVTGAYDGVGRIWTKEGVLSTCLTGHQGPIFALKWNPQGDMLLSASYDSTTAVWNPTTGRMTQQWSLHTAPTLDVAWKDNTTFASCSTDKSIHVCQMGAPEPICSWRSHEDEVNTIAWNPAKNVLASCSDDQTLKLWQLSRPTALCDFREHTKEVYTLAWAPAGPGSANPNQTTLLASASFDATVKLWDVTSEKCLYTLKHNDSVYSVAFSPNGQYLASGSLNGVLNIWCTSTGRLVKSCANQGDIYSVDWNSRGDLLSVAFADRQLAVVNFRL